MRQDLLFGGSYAAGAVKQYTIGRGHLNGLLFYLGVDSYETRITVKRRVGKNTHLLLPNVRMTDLRRISSIEYGYDYFSDAVALGIRDVLTSDPDGAGAGVPYITGAAFDAKVGNLYGSLSTPLMVYIPLGSIYLGQDSELDITVTAGSDWPAGNQTVKCYGMSHSRLPDHMLQTDYSVQLEETHRNVDALYAVTNGLRVFFNLGALPDVQCQITDDEQATITDFTGLYAATQVFGAIEGHAAPDILVLYRKRDAIPADVWCKLSGAGASMLNLLVRKIIYDAGQLSANTAAELTGLRQRVAKLEQSSPDTAKALRHAGEITKSSQLADVEATVSAANAADGIRAQ